LSRITNEPIGLIILITSWLTINIATFPLRSNGHHNPGTDTYFFVELKNIPKDSKITYGKIVCDYKPHKKEKERVRLAVGGDRLDYSGDVATSTADITTFKILINSTPSTADAAMMTMDIKTTTWALPCHALNT
jgi:hypothetical protein